MKIFLATPHSFKIVHDHLFSGLLSLRRTTEGQSCSADYGTGLATNKQTNKQMRCYLAGSVTRPFAVKEGMQCFLSGPHADYGSIWKSNHSQPEQAMQVYLSLSDRGSGACYKNHETLSGKASHVPRIAILESFYYMQDWMLPYIQNYWNFLLDSGAFTFMTGKNDGKGIDWNDYVDRYAEFITAQKIDLFFEMDIDNIVGLPEVERLRRRLEAKTGKQPIIVWHKKRGKQAFLDSCQHYPYVALGGIVAKEWERKEYQFFPWFIDTAHNYGAKIHGLGFTNLSLLPKYHFDSVDSTAWVYGNMSGKIYYFTGKSLKYQDKQEGQRLKSAKDAAIHNFKEWVKFQRYAEEFL